MSKMDLVSTLLGQPVTHELSIPEKMLLEIRLVSYIYQHLAEFFKLRYAEYQSLIKSDNQENQMVSDNLVQEVIQDILLTGEYSLTGISIYTGIPEEALCDIVGMNMQPTFETTRKIFDLHISVRRNLYNEIVGKIMIEFATKKDIKKLN